MDQAELKGKLTYNTDTGVFTWLISQGSVKAGSTAGNLHPSGYLRIRIKGVDYLAHRLAWLYVYGVFPEKEIDHKNRIRHDNWISNLRDVPHEINMANNGLNLNNTTGYIGVTKSRNGEKWVAHIRVRNKKIHLGTFNTKEEAILAREKANKQQFDPLG